MESSNDIVILTQARPRSPRLVIAGCVAHCHADYHEFQRSQVTPAAFIVKSDDEHYAGGCLRQLRRDPDHATALAFIDGAASDADRHIGDGALPGSAALLIERIEQWRSRERAVRSKGDNRGPDAMLLEYMWLRPGYVLEPLADWQYLRRYRYPVLEALDRSESDPMTWIHGLDKHGLIERVALRDRQRECDFCGSAHLNFVDVCPNCRSIDIDQHTALHCFTCGLVAPEERYIKGEHRICPKCGTRLRHIGSDYDRPLETNLCLACDHVFVEGEVEARCAVCKRSMPTTRLRLHKIHSWRLSGRGCLTAQGDGGHGQTLFEPRQYLPYPHFLGSLDWALKLAREGSHFGFAVAGLHLANMAELNQALGVGRTAELLDAFADRLRESLSDADLATRADPETIVVLLPHADRKRLAALHQTMRRLVAQSVQENAAGPSWRIAEHLLTAKSARDEDSATLLRRLRSRLADNATQQVA
ncbi:MAG: diguanylate cyclase [Nevskia sp.]|nr:diguanylate cyclase [Nevskia sp.]